MGSDQYASTEEILGSPEAGNTQDPASGASQDEGSSAAVQAAPYQFVPDNYKYVYKGQEYFPKDRNHLTALVQKGHAFETNQERLNRERQEIDQARNQYKRYGELDEALKKYPEFAQKIFAELQNVQKPNQQQPGQEQGQQAGIPPEYAAKLEQLEQWKQQSEQRQADQELMSEMDKLKKENPDFDWNTDNGEGDLSKQLLRFAYDNQIPNIHQAFKAMMFDRVKQQSAGNAAVQVKNAVQQNAKRGIVAAPSGVQASAKRPAALDHSKHSLNQLAEMAKQEFNIK